MRDLKERNTIMKKRISTFLSLLLVSCMLIGMLASCTDGNTDDTSAPADTQGNTEASDTAAESEKQDTESSPSDSSGTSESTGKSEQPTESDQTTESEAPEEETKLTGDHATVIENADKLKNNVTAYYGSDGMRNNVFFENMEMKLGYNLASGESQLVTSLTNKKGNAYVTDTMDVFVRMTDGRTFYAGSTSSSSKFNIHRFGYYYYQMRVEGQDFIGNLPVLSVENVRYQKPTSTNEVASAKYNGESLVVKNANPAKDPFITYNKLTASADKHTVLEISIKADEKASAGVDLFFIAGNHNDYSGEQRLRFTISADNQWHTYRIPLYSGADYNGDVKAIRLDISGSGATYEIKDVKFLEIDVQGIPANLSLCRTFNVYSDKMHQVIQVATTEETNNILEIGMLTKISADTVAKLVVADKDGVHETIDGVDWDSVEYIAFDIVDAGIFGYILPYDGQGGKLNVILEEGVYVIEQTLAPKNGTIIPSRTDYNTERKYYNWVEGGNTNDFYMGQRIYTDPGHDFEEFLNEAYCERNPLNNKYIKVNAEASTNASFFGYDSLRGIYRFNVAGCTGGFNEPYFSSPDRHYRASFTIKGDDRDRSFYVMTYTSSGQLECAVILDKNDVMLPIPMEVGKNFSEQGGERNLYNLADFTYGEAIIPMVVKAGEKAEYTILNIYQNWGKYPLKQLSWIQFYSPYYHLSTGVTETNCIVPWTFTNQIWYNTLPDFRGMSAPFWASQPQHTSCCEHDWLKYTDSEGNVVRTENVANIIDSYGPTYADVRMDYFTYDGKMKVSYTHSEMPQLDENRTYYEIKYEVLGDVTINDVVNNLQLYKVAPNDSTGKYKKVGYLNSENKSVVTDANETEAPVKYTLGTECPYFSFFDMENWNNSDGYANLGFLIYNSEFIIGGEKAEPNFAIVNHTDTVYVTLDLETLTLKAGDSITISCILLPWGSQLLEDGKIDPESNNFEYDMVLDNGEKYMDKNVRDVRTNTLLNPLKAVADKDCEVVDSVFIPKLRTTNGESAEFTLTGGYNNAAVRIYGFSKMTVPVIYEKIDGEWQVYEVSSRNAKKDAHKYDGYCIHYDGDGTFSYSFVTTMDGKNDRTFKIVADGNYEKWQQESGPQANARPDKLNIYADYVEIADNGLNLIQSQFISKLETFDDGEYVRLYGAGPDAKYAEGYVMVYKPAAANVESGKYLAIKYRVPTTNTETIGRFEFFISTAISSPKNGDCMTSVSNIKHDGEWHVIVIDLSKVEKEVFKQHFAPDSEGKYYPQFLRLDFFDKRMSTSSYVDIGFVGMDDSMADIVALCADVKSLTLVEGSGSTDLNPSTGDNLTQEPEATPEVPEVLVDPSSGYTHAKLEYGAQIDKINGINNSVQGGSKAGVTIVKHNASTIADHTVDNRAEVEGYYLAIGGWCVVEGGVSKYVWSADGGKTWHEATPYGRSAGSASQPMIEAAYARSNKTYNFTIDTDAANGTYQGAQGSNPTGLGICLEEYKGQSVNIIYGVIPAKDTSSVLPLFYITGVKVAE